MINNLEKKDKSTEKAVLQDNQDNQEMLDVEQQIESYELPRAIRDLLTKVFQEENVSNIAQKVILKLIEKIIKIKNNIQDKQLLEENKSTLTHDVKNYDHLEKALKNIWQDNFKKNMLYVKRGMNWLKLEILVDDNINNLIEFFNKLLNLGQLLSEDTLHLSAYDAFSLNKEEALKRRRALTENKDNLAILSNNGHYMHKSLLSELNALNKIIAKKSH